MVSNMAYGTRVRRVQLTRGNRQGNNAFLEDSNNNRMDPITYVGVALFVFAVTAVACFVPARRATMVDPVMAFRGQ